MILAHDPMTEQSHLRETDLIHYVHDLWLLGTKNY